MTAADHGWRADREAEHAEQSSGGEEGEENQTPQRGVPRSKSPVSGRARRTTVPFYDPSKQPLDPRLGIDRYFSKFDSK